MTGYDFDRTIYRGYSFIDFYFFCLRRRFWLALVFPFQVLFGVLTLSFTRRRLKQVFCLFLLLLPYRIQLYLLLHPEKLQDLERFCELLF